MKAASAALREERKRDFESVIQSIH